MLWTIFQVPYNLSGWLEKNKDPLNDTVVDQYKNGHNELVKVLFADHPGQTGPDAGGGAGGKGKGDVNMSLFFPPIYQVYR